MEAFFKSPEKNKLSKIAADLKQWQMAQQHVTEDGRWQMWNRNTYSRQCPPASFLLSEGFPDDDTRHWEFKKALVNTVLNPQSQINILFGYAFKAHD